MHNASSPDSPPQQQPPHVPGFLLHGLTIALLFCIFAVGAFYIYSSLNNLISHYRREMNASAYNALVYFDQREAQLRAVADALIPLPPDVALPSWDAVDMQQLNLYRVANSDARHTWFLLQSTRNLEQLDRLHSRAIFSSPYTGETRYVLSPEVDIDPALQSWIANLLASRKPTLGNAGGAPLLWLVPPDNNQTRLFLFTPVLPGDPRAGWIGLEVDQVDQALAQAVAHIDAQSVALINPQQQPVLSYGPANPLNLRLSSHGQADEFYLHWNNLLPSHIVLSKSIGEAGWRLIFTVPFARLLDTLLPQLIGVSVIMLLLATLVLIRIHLVRRRIIAPARAQYVALQEASWLTRTMINAAPVGLCLVRESDLTPIVANARAHAWLQTKSPPLAPGSREEALADGSTVHLDIVQKTYYDEPVLLCAISDVSSLKDVEQSLMAAKHKADNANRAKTEFIATMSHEIRTPLFGILGSLELLSLTEMTPKQQQYMRTIQSSSNTLLRTINETLDLSQVESGYAQLILGDTSPTDLVYSIIASYADRARSKGLRLYCVVDPQTPALVEADELRIRQILNNLVSNAIKFTMGGHVVLRLHVSRNLDSTVTLNFQVADTGIGMPKARQDKLFSPYYQIDQPQASTDIAGSGLGLFICKRLADMMQGRFSIVSSVGLGTSIEFTVTVPIRPASQEDPLPATTVYVHGGIPEVTHNLCNWLNHWGANALVYQAEDANTPADAMLLCAWPSATSEPDWRGTRIAMLPPGQIPDDDTLATTWYCNAFDLHDLLRTLRHAQTQRLPSMAAPTQPLESAFGLRVLVVDDNDINRQVLHEQLTRLGCQTILAQDGQDAMQRFHAVSIDCILTDINMPLMDGYALAQTLRAQGYAGPLFGVTASAYHDDAQRATAAGMDALLIRPLSLATLRDTLRQAASRSARS